MSRRPVGWHGRSSETTSVRLTISASICLPTVGAVRPTMTALWFTTASTAASSTNVESESHLNRLARDRRLGRNLFAATAAVVRGLRPLGCQPKRKLRQTSLLFADRCKKTDDVAHFLVGQP